MFSKDVSRVCVAFDVVEAGDASGDGLSCTVVGEGIVALVQLGVGHRGSVDDRFVVAKHEGRTVEGNTEVTQCRSQVDDLLCAGPGCNIFGAEGSRLYCGLEFGEPIDRCLVEEVQDTSDGASTNKIMVEIGVDVGRGLDRLAKGFGGIRRDVFLCTGVAGVFPFEVFLGNAAEIRHGDVNADGGLFEFRQVTEDAFEAIEVTLLGGGAEAGHGHDGSRYIKASKLDSPLETTDEGLVDLDVVKLEEWRRIQLGMVALDEG